MINSDSQFDKKPFQITKDNKKRHRETMNIFQSQTRVNNLRDPIKKSRFIFNCQEYTKKSKVEHLIIGLGIYHKRSLRIYRILHTVGDMDSIEIPKSVGWEIITWLSGYDTPHIVVFHNHPPGPDGEDDELNYPCASPDDREVALIGNLKTLLGAAVINAVLGMTKKQIINKYGPKRIRHYVCFQNKVVEYLHVYQGYFPILLSILKL